MSAFYVSPRGDDADSGISVKTPFATIGAAIKAMAATSTADVTYILDGTFYLDGSGLSLTDANSNDTIAAYPGAKPVISGGTLIAASSWSVSSDGVWRVQLNGSDIDQVVVAGIIQTPARYPNIDVNDPARGGWLWAKPLPDGGNLLQQLAYDPADFPSDRQPAAGQKVTVFNANNWSNNVLSIASVDPTKHIITFDKPATYHFGPGSRYFVSGSAAFLDQPGEWYFDQTTKTLYFQPPTGFDGQGVVVAGALDLINISEANNIAIKGLSFSDTGSKASDESAISTAAVAIHNSSGVIIEACDFKHVSQGVRIAGTSNNITVASNDFSNIWGPAALLGRGTSHNFITDNSIKNSGEVFAGSAAIQLENTYGNTIAKNDIRDVPRAGIAVTHSDIGVKSGGNVIKDNSIVDSGQMTNHSGAIHAGSFIEKSTLSNTISGNTIVNTGGLSTADSGFVSEQSASAGIYVEGISGGSKIFGNAIKGTTLAGIFLLGSDNNDVHDNIVADDDSGVGKASAVSVVPVGSEGGSSNVINNNSIEQPPPETTNAHAETGPVGLSINKEDVDTAPATIADGAAVEIDGASAQSVTFEGATGTLKLDDSVDFTGQVSGLTGADAVDLTDVSFGSATTATFLGNASGGTLTVSDGTHTANIELQGDYLSSTWDVSSDGKGGTIVVDPVSTNTWQTLPVGAGGFVDGIDIAPDDTMVVRTDSYGAYIWNGTEWQQLVTTTSMPAAFIPTNNVGASNGGNGVYEIQIAPSNSNILYMMYDGDVFKSINKGTTWTQTSFATVTESPNTAYRMDGQKMAIDPENSNIVYAGTPQNGLFVTTNGGTTWQSVSAVPDGLADSSGVYPGITGIEFDPALGVSGGKTNTIFAASFGDGVYESTNGGTSWSAIGGPSDVAYAAVSSTGVYYAVGNGNSLWSYNKGAWTDLLSLSGIATVAVDPFNPNEIVAQEESGTLDISYNGGATWSGADSSANFKFNSPDVPWLSDTGSYMTIGGTVFDQLTPNTLLASDGIGVWSTTNLPTQGLQSNTPVVWNSQSEGIEQLVANEIIVPPGGDPVLASWDRGFFTINNQSADPSTYGPVNGKFAAGWSVDYASSDPSFLVGLADWWGNEESGYSTNGGQTWTAFPTFIPGASTAFMGGTIAASTPNNIIWAPADGVDPYYTLNGGQTWNPITLPGVTSWKNFDFAYYLDTETVTADRVLANTFYLYDPGIGVFETTNGGVSWTKQHGPVSGADNANSEIQSVPGEAGNLFFTSGPQNNASTAPDKLAFYRSTDQGVTWTAIPNVLDVSCFGFGAAAPGQSYPSIYIVGWVNNVYGIWQSTNNTQSWTQIGTYPTGSLDLIRTIAGDPNVYGQVYVGFAGDGYAEFTANPSVTGVTATPSKVVEQPGDTITLTLNMSEAVTVTGTPTLSLNDGGTATYKSGSGSNALTFTYTVSNSDHDVPALGITQVNLPNGATIADANANAANLAGAVTTISGLQIDPPAAVLSVTTSGSGITNGHGDLKGGQVITFTINLSQATYVSGTPTLTLKDGGTATYTGGSGTDALTFSYKVIGGQNTPDLAITAVNLGPATVTDVLGKAINLTGAVTNPGGILQIDTTDPTIASVVASGVGISNSLGDLDAGRVVTLTLKMSEAVFVANGTPTLTLNDGGVATYTGGSGTSSLSFSYTVAAGQNVASLAIAKYNLGTATITDAAGNPAILSYQNLTNLKIDTTAPTIASVVESPATGTLGDGKIVTLKLAFSDAITVANGTPTLTLNDGGVATYTSGSGTKTLTFSYTVANGQATSALAATALNLNNATISDGAGNTAKLSLAGLTQTGPRITGTDTTTTTTTSATVSSVSVSGNGITNGSGDLDAGHGVTLTLHMRDAVTIAGGTPTLTLNDGGVATYTGGSGSTALAFSYTVAAGQNTSDLAITGINFGTAKLTDAAGTIASLAGIATNPPGILQIDTIAPPAPVIISDPPSASGRSVQLTGTAEPNSTVTIYDNQVLLGKTVATGTGAWRYTTGTLANGAQIFTAIATDHAGNASALSSPLDPIIGQPIAPESSPNSATASQPNTHGMASLAAASPVVQLLDQRSHAKPDEGPATVITDRSLTVSHGVETYGDHGQEILTTFHSTEHDAGETHTASLRPNKSLSQSDHGAATALPEVPVPMHLGHDSATFSAITVSQTRSVSNDVIDHAVQFATKLPGSHGSVRLANVSLTEKHLSFAGSSNNDLSVASDDVENQKSTTHEPLGGATKDLAATDRLYNGVTANGSEINPFNRVDHAEVNPSATSSLGGSSAQVAIDIAADNFVFRFDPASELFKSVAHDVHEPSHNMMDLGMAWSGTESHGLDPFGIWASDPITAHHIELLHLHAKSAQLL